MHKLKLAGLILAGMLAIGVTGATQAMQPASNAELSGCLGLWASGGCIRTGTCNPGPFGQGDITNCTKYDDGGICIFIMASNAENVTCESNEGDGCSSGGTGSPCLVYETGTCETNPQNNSSSCDTALGNGQAVDVGTYETCK